MYIDHEFTHSMIAGLSFTKEGHDLVKNLEAMRYYHRDGKSFYLGDGAHLIVSYNESPEYMEDNKIIGVLYLPGNPARTIEHVRSHDMDRLREAIGLDETKQKRIVFDMTYTMVSELLVRMRKILNLVTNYQDREYFDNVSPVQALVHLMMDDYSPHDIKF